MVGHIKIILRAFSRNKSYTTLNILGLTSGLIVFIIISLYTAYEFSFDNYHENLGRVYRVYKEDVDNYYQGSNKYAVTPGPMADALMTDYPEVAYAARVNWGSNTLIKANDEVHMASRVYLADPEIFKILSFNVVSGELSGFLNEPSSVVLSSSEAIKLFGTTDIVGEVIHFANQYPMTVTGVFEDMPSNSHFVMDLVFHFEGTMTARGQRFDRWNNNSYHTFLMLEEGADVVQLQQKMPELRAKYADDPIDEDGQETSYILQPLSEVHFTKGVNFDIAPNSDAQSLYIYLAIAFMVLIIAGINYVNLATARSINRVKEIGIRKVVGAENRSLMTQFLLESFLLVSFSMLLAIAALVFIVPEFAQFVDRPLALDFGSVQFWTLLVGLSVVLSVLAGLYPAFVLTSFKPVAALKGRGEVRQRGALFRNILVIFQFAISSGLIIGATVLSQQLNFIQNVDTGYVRDQIIVLSMRDSKIRNQMEVFTNEISKVPGVINVAGSSSLPNNISSSTNARWPGRGEDVRIPIYTASVGWDFFDLYELEFVAGGPFRREVESDKYATILNEKAVEAIGWDDPIGKQYITQQGDTGRVVGVLKNFNQHSLHLGIEPLQLFLRDNHWRVSIKMSGDNLKQTLAGVKEVYNTFNSAYPFDYNYFDDIFDRAYQSDIKTGQLAQWFTILTILIACLGLYGLAAHKVQQRVKEVGVRKVLGASVTRILFLLSRDFVKLLLIAFLIAAPLAYYVMNDWLNGFAFHISIGALTMVITLGMMILVAGLTVGYRTFRAAVRNPVEALREE